eukprot:CAMPEP_0172761946 /NCGR_PEP_ID=MMETSP1074-20121228/172524_1 /TAXON_ID=2916 /ORGANISM="Ceratium fusus, Strain PA161109" /LENGTH=59 /DNA_ID=CAMNT_0013596249 /DNA_START=468 /DNA_END=643 /DNA_ORIENTATION=-
MGSLQPPKSCADGAALPMPKRPLEVLSKLSPPAASPSPRRGGVATTVAMAPGRTSGRAS